MKGYVRSGFRLYTTTVVVCDNRLLIVLYSSLLLLGRLCMLYTTDGSMEYERQFTTTIGLK
jgi:hypothetical protein